MWIILRTGRGWSGSGEHGLFTDAGKAVVLSQVQEEVARHKGAVWTHVISLRRGDAERLGYNHADQWQSLLRSKRSMLCRHMKIKSENLRWYAAFHNEGHHPACAPDGVLGKR